MGLTLEPFEFIEDVYDVLFLTLREKDIEEIEAFTGQSPREALTQIINHHDILFTIKDNYDRILGIFGIVYSSQHSTEYKKVGQVVFVATRELFETHKFSFLRKAKVFLRDFLQAYDYDTIFNYSVKENKKWLEFLNFNVYETEVIFKNRRKPFYFFSLERR
jgi:hypothetical protein